jgi:hypothetical protein
VNSVSPHPKKTKKNLLFLGERFSLIKRNNKGSLNREEAYQELPLSLAKHPDCALHFIRRYAVCFAAP